MIYLALTVFSTVLLFLIFKEYGKRNIDRIQAITFNYLTAGLISFFIGSNEYNSDILNEPWITSSIFLGIYFIIMFNIMGKTTQKLGITTASLSSKMSLIIPVIYAIIFQEDKASLIKIFGITLALSSLYLIIRSDQKKRGPIYLAIILFFGAGILDTILSSIQNNYLHDRIAYGFFTTTVFFSAFLTGLFVLIFKRKKIKYKSILGGIALGIPNYFSIYYLLLALEQIETSLVFPLLNIGVVALSSVIGVISYKEHLTKTNITGVIIAILAIILLMNT